MKHNNFFAAVSRLGWLRAASLFALVLFAGSLTASAQSGISTITTGHIVHNIVKQTQVPPELGRDYWFAPIQNYLDEPGKYYRLYITSPNNTTAFVESQGVTKAVPVPSYGIGTFNCPLEWEMKSSCIVENKGIHVYDPTDDICVYLMSHNPYTSDGARLIPTTGWGTDYVVVAYEALFEGFGSYVFDFPSELSITADQDNTEVTVTPSQNCRLSTQYPNGSTTIGALQGKPFQFTLNQGQSLQMQTTAATDADNFDLTGTIVHANVGVDIMAGSCCPNIPPDFPYCDEICDQVPPIRAWAETYYTTNSIQPVGEPTHDENLYCMVSSVPGQTIYRYSPTQGTIVEGTLGPKYDHLYSEEEGPNKWYSDQPFLLFEYLNSSTYPDGVNGYGDPADCPITPLENYTKDVVFETPSSQGSQAPYDNYANVIVNVADQNNVLFDGKKITNYTREQIDGNYEIFIVPHIVPAAHTVTSDSGCGVYIYGYGYDESYMWSGGFGNGTFHSPDTIPPNEVITGQCYQANIHLTDSGYLPGSTPQNPLLQSGLNEIRLDSDVNMAYLPDLYPNWIDGSPSTMDTSGYSMFVVDETKPAILKVDIFDAAGNETTITSTYVPQVATIVKPLQDFGVVITGQAAVCKYDTLINTGAVPFNFSTLKLEYGNRGFTLDSVPESPLPVGKEELVKICFYPVQQTEATDTIIFGDSCITQQVAVIGSGGAPDFYVDDVVWQNVPLNPPANLKNLGDPGGWVPMAAEIHNESATDTLHVTLTGWGNQVNFVLSGTPSPLPPANPTSYTAQSFPITVPPGAPTPVWFWFEPDSLNRVATWGSWTAKEVDSADSNPVVKYDSLIGNAITPTLTFVGDTTILIACPNGLDTNANPVDTLHLAFPISNSGTQDAVINKVILTNPAGFINFTAVDQHGNSWNPATPNNLPPGAVDTIKMDFVVTPETNLSASTQIYALDISGDTIGGVVLSASVNIIYRSAQVSTDQVNFGPVPYQSPNGKITRSFTITNTQSSDLELYPFSLEQGGKYDSAYSFYLSIPIGDSLALLPGQTDTVYVTFDPSKYFDTVQSAALNMQADWCGAFPMDFLARVTVSGASVSLSPALPEAPILSCDNQTTTITVVNHEPSDAAEDVYAVIDSTYWVGANPVRYFSIPGVQGDTVLGGLGTFQIPVTFAPGAGQQVNQMYSDSLAIVLHGAWGWDTTMIVAVGGTASSINISASATFPTLAASSAAPGGTLNLPVNVNQINENGLNGQLPSLNIDTVILTFIVQNGNFVVPGNMNTTSGWTASAPVWTPTPAPGFPNEYTLTEVLTGSTLDENVTTSGFGMIPFKLYLDTTNDISNVMFTSMVLVESNGDTIPATGSCVTTSTSGGSMSLILQCGDSTLRLLMSGQGNLINLVNPATPDPVTGGHVTFSYANRGATNITLSIFDVLGKEVMRPIDNVYHDAGSWQTTTDVSTLSSGTYTYRFSAEGNVISRQFVIQR